MLLIIYYFYLAILLVLTNCVPLLPLSEFKLCVFIDRPLQIIDNELLKINWVTLHVRLCPPADH